MQVVRLCAMNLYLHGIGNGERTSAVASVGNNNTATAIGNDVFACAGDGDSDETAYNEDLCDTYEY